MTQFIDLDDLIAQDITVKLAGREYQLPGDLPIPVMLALVGAWEDLTGGNGDPDASALALYARALDLFQIRQPDLESLPLGVLQVGKLLMAVYGVSEPQVDPQSAPPTTGGAARGTTQTTPRKRKATRAKASV